MKTIFPNSIALKEGRQTSSDQYITPRAKHDTNVQDHMCYASSALRIKEGMNFRWRIFKMVESPSALPHETGGEVPPFP